jgi:hypothetical protein
MLSNLAATHNKMKFSLIRTVSVCLLLCGAVITASGQNDGEVLVQYGDVYKKGGLKIERSSLSNLPPLPPGYAVFNNSVYIITTRAVVSGPHTIRFTVPSIDSEATFNRLRVFHLEQPPYDPEGKFWEDRTVLTSNRSPDFSTKTINAETFDLGFFVVAQLVEKTSVVPGLADLVVSYLERTDQLTSPTLITHTIKIINKGPSTANEVGVVDSMAGYVVFRSAQSTQGACKERTGTIFCKLGNLKLGESAIVTVVLQPYEGKGSFPNEGVRIPNSAYAHADEADPEPANNQASVTTLVLPDPNLPPAVWLTSPKDRALFKGNTQVTFEADAKDPDGTVSGVIFYDNGKAAGTGITTDGRIFTCTLQGLTLGQHTIWAVATDNGGRSNESTASTIIVNGAAEVSMGLPREGALIEPNSIITLSANATDPSGDIAKVEFFANDRLIGEGKLAKQNQYTLDWKLERSTYSIVAVVTNSAGVTTTSSAVTVTVSKEPVVSLVDPSTRRRLIGPTNVSLEALATQFDGSIKRVDFYANDKLIGSASDDATERFLVTWRGVTPGEYTLKAIAVNDLGVSVSSKTVNITVARNKN